MDDSSRRAVKPESADCHDDHGAFSHRAPAPSGASGVSQPYTTMTMSLALDYFDAKATCDPKRRKMIVLDVKRAFKREPVMAGLPANGHSVRYTLKKFAESKTSKNMISSIRAVLKFVHDDVPRSQTTVVLDCAWTALLNRGNIPKYKRFNFARLARYCQQRGIEPKDVTDAVLADFYEYIEQLDTIKEPRKLLCSIVSSWNTYLKYDNELRLQRLNLPKLNSLPQLTPAMSDLSGSIAAELGQVLEFMAADPVASKRKRFDRREASEGGPRSERKQLSKSTCLSYGKYLRRAVRTLGEDPDRDGPVVSLREIVSPENVEFILNTMSDELEARAKGERALSLMGCAILYLAKHYYAVDEADLVQIKRMYNQVGRPEPKMTVKNLRRLRSLVLAKRHELMRLPAKLLNRTIKAIKEGRRAARLLVDAQVAVVVAILPTIPIREANVAAIRRGEHLQVSERRGTTGRLTIPAALVKNGVAIDRLVPVDVAEVLRAYIKHVLPLLRADPNSTALFPGRKGNTTRGPACLGTKVSERIREHLGIEMNLHLFRHFVALMYLEEHPGEYEVVRILLGNRNLEIVKAFYAGAEHDAAIARANKVVAKVKLDAGLNPKNMLEVTEKPKRRAG